ncbi:hypothetical protein NHQ30_008576 [Ciborinia camelliae]|nr:hypothetical protein NHQ30_008576 [Ciborinia camelliae]
MSTGHNLLASKSASPKTSGLRNVFGVGYSTLLTSGSAHEQSLTVTSEDSKVLINSTEVITTYIVASKGVMHVIANILNPSNAAIVESAHAVTQPIAFSKVPFTSGITATTMAMGAATGMIIKMGAGETMVGEDSMGDIVAAVVEADIVI